MKLKECREVYYESSKVASEFVIKMSIIGVIVALIFYSSKIIDSNRFNIVIVLFLVVHVLHLLQYIYKSISFAVIARQKEIEGKKSFKIDPRVNWSTIVLFYMKMFLTIVTYILLIS